MLYLKIGLLPIFIALTGLTSSWIISCSQIESAEKIAVSQQKLFALQIFSDRLMEGRIRREANLKLIKTLDDTILKRSLTDISNRAVLDILRDSIWDTTSATTRENAIIEFAKLYNNKEYRMETIDAVIPRGYHLKKFEPLISIAKFFYYLEVYSDSLWYGTKLDSARFASIQKSVFYKIKGTKY